MAQSVLVTCTVVKIIRSNQSVVEFPSGKDVTINLTGAEIYPVVIAGHTGTDSLIRTPDGTQYFCIQEFTDLNTAISATQSTGS